MAKPAVFQDPPLRLAWLRSRDPDSPDTGRTERRFLCPYGQCVGYAPTQDHRSLSVNVQTGAWKCHRCDRDGLCEEYFTIDKAEPKPRQTRPQRARAQLAAAFSLSERRSEPESPATWRNVFEVSDLTASIIGTLGATYLAGRGIPEDLAAAAGVRYARDWFGSAAVVFPMVDRAGQIVAAQGRSVTGRRLLADGPKRLGVFLTPGALEADPVVVVEAPIDGLSLALCGLAAIALCGKSGPAWIPKALAFRRVALAFDNDDGGDQATATLTPLLERYGCTVERWQPAAKDWNAQLMRDGADELRRALAQLSFSDTLSEKDQHGDRWELANLAIAFRYPGIGQAAGGEPVLVAPGVDAWAVFLDAASDEQITRSLRSLQRFGF
jgi:hypothetical protein